MITAAVELNVFSNASLTKDGSAAKTDIAWWTHTTSAARPRRLSRRGSNEGSSAMRCVGTGGKSRLDFVSLFCRRLVRTVAPSRRIRLWASNQEVTKQPPTYET